MNSLHSYSYQSPPPKFTLKCLESKKKIFSNTARAFPHGERSCCLSHTNSQKARSQKENNSGGKVEEKKRPAAWGERGPSLPS